MADRISPSRAAKAARDFLMNLLQWWSDELDYRDALINLKQYEEGFEAWWHDDPTYLRSSERARRVQRDRMRQLMEPDGYMLCAAAREWDLPHDAILEMLSGWKTGRVREVDMQAKAIYHRAQIERALAGEDMKTSGGTRDPEVTRRCDAHFAEILGRDRWAEFSEPPKPAGNPAAHERKREKATVAAWAYINSNPSPLEITCTELAAACDCSPSLMNTLAPWKDLMARKRKNRSAETVRLTSKMEKIVGATDDSVEKLIAEQEADAEPSPLDRKKAKVYARR